MAKRKTKTIDDVIFDIPGLNIHVVNSYKIRSKTKIKEKIKEIMETVSFHELCVAGFRRTYKSMVNEWMAHNFLYEHNYKKESTGSVDIDQAEGLLRRFCYWILAKLYKGEK